MQCLWADVWTVVIEMRPRARQPHLRTNRASHMHRLSTRSSSSFQYLLEQVIVPVQGLILLAQGSDGPARVQNGRVVPVAESFADLGQAELGQIPRECHCHLARTCNVACALLRMHVGELD